LEDAIDAVEQFAHGSHQSDHLELAMGKKMAVVVSAEVGVAPDRDQRGHEQSAAEMAVADFADPDFLRVSISSCPDLATDAKRASYERPFDLEIGLLLQTGVALRTL